MVKQIACAVLVALAAAAPAGAATITLQAGAPILVGSFFDVDVLVNDVFDGRAPGETLTSFGFDVTTGDPSIVQFDTATAGPLFDVLVLGNQTFGFSISLGGVGPGDFTAPLLLATLRFNVFGAGTTTIGILGDSFPDTGLVFSELPFEVIDASTAVTAVAPTAVPEPASIMLLGGGLAAFVARRRRRRPTALENPTPR